MIGKVTPESLKPVPVSAAALTVTGAVPVEVKVSDSVEVEFTGILPKDNDVALTNSCGVVTAVPVPLSCT